MALKSHNTAVSNHKSTRRVTASAPIARAIAILSAKINFPEAKIFNLFRIPIRADECQSLCLYPTYTEH